MPTAKNKELKSVVLVFPHQLFRSHPAMRARSHVFIVEESLFFSQYSFHKQKLRFHRASMRFYCDYLRSEGHTVEYIESSSELSDTRKLIAQLAKDGVEAITFCDVADDWLRKRIRSSAKGMGIEEFDSPAFLETKAEIISYFEGKKRYFQTDFYIGQRKRLGILLEPGLVPKGGKWSFDAENRKRYPKNKIPPTVSFPRENLFDSEARSYVERNFPSNPGSTGGELRYPTTFDEADVWLQEFLDVRFAEFGGFEDSIVKNESFINHSVLSPLLNSGLLTPAEVVARTIEHAERHDVPLNSCEGFIRQIIGWREFIRGVYEVEGARERTRNHWKFSRGLPKSFWTGTTGIEPVDTTIGKVLATGYCHHIERLMVLGNFMLLCEFDPDDVYRWFMEMFIDAYDWVMVPNVYGMSQFADGGLFATKPYISGSNYLMKMGDYSKGPWQAVWDGLFWRFMDKNRAFFLKNPRLSMLVRTFDKMAPEKRLAHIETAEAFLSSL